MNFSTVPSAALGQGKAKPLASAAGLHFTYPPYPPSSGLFFAPVPLFPHVQINTPPPTGPLMMLVLPVFSGSGSQGSKSGVGEGGLAGVIVHLERIAGITILPIHKGGGGERPPFPPSSSADPMIPHNPANPPSPHQKSMDPACP